jgi:CheY-like chemotaxis protein
MLKPTVLVLDDDDDNVQILEAALQSSGFDVRMARSCAEARALLAVAPVDALVTDYSLGDGDALELVAELGDRRPRVAVLVTGYGRPEDRERSRAAGFDAHLVKPVALEELELVLRQALERTSRKRHSSEPPAAG